MANISEIFKNALTYPTTDIKALIILGILFVINGLSSVLIDFGFNTTGYVSLVLGLVTIIVSIIISGYEISVIKEGIEKGTGIPQIDPMKNFVDGIKVVILNIVYYIIPTIITFILLFATGTINAIVNILMFYSNNSINATLPSQYVSSLITGGAVTGIIAAILFIVFALLCIIGTARFAKYDSLSEGISIGEVIKDIGTIGWGSYIVWFIVYIIISIILAMILGLIIAYVPYIGNLIGLLIITPFIALFANRAIGELYSEI